MNLLSFITKIAKNKELIKLESHYIGKNRANNMGDALECFIKDGLSDSLDIKDEEERLKRYNTAFSYLGNSNNPPDLIIKKSDAVEIKKVETMGAALALNSSYPKKKLFSNSNMITQACRDCEAWDEKDMLYIVGHVAKNELHSLWLVYGDCFCASKETYERIKNKISKGITEIQNVEFTETNELGKVKKVDPLGITDLRIRGMWHIENPYKIFSYLNIFDEKSKFQAICIMTKTKYNSFPLSERKIIETNTDNIVISEKKIKDPENPANLIDVVVIVWRIKQ